mgnify:CR=1 FL=1
MASRLPVTKQEVKTKKNHCGRYALRQSGRIQ